MSYSGVKLFSEKVHELFSGLFQKWKSSWMITVIRLWRSHSPEILTNFGSSNTGIKDVVSQKFSILIRAVFIGGAGNLEVLLTLFQPEGADYAHHITASTPRFENLKTSLLINCCPGSPRSKIKRPPNIQGYFKVKWTIFEHKKNI